MGTILQNTKATTDAVSIDAAYWVLACLQFENGQAENLIESTEPLSV